MSNNQFKRGFKAWCEKTAMAYRESLQLAPYSPLSPLSLIPQLNVMVVNFDNLSLPEESKQYLAQEGAEEWSAVTVSLEGKTAIIVNDVHNTGRKNNSLMHELSHLILKHDPTSVNILSEGNIALRSYNEKSEKEADWLAATLLLPKPALQRMLDSRNTTKESLLETYGVSDKLYTFRLNMTGLGRRATAHLNY